MLELKFDEIKRKFRNQEIPLPSAWGGYRVVPHSFEFWQGRPNRLHARFLMQLLFDGNQQDRTASLFVFSPRCQLCLGD